MNHQSVVRLESHARGQLSNFGLTAAKEVFARESCPLGRFGAGHHLKSCCCVGERILGAAIEALYHYLL
jgi:hypothetical protein